MKYGFYLDYNTQIAIGLHGHWGELVDHSWADIMCWTDNENEEDEENDEMENKDLNIGFICWATYNQALAKVYGVNMADLIYLASRKECLALDYTLINQKTIDEIGPATNLNIVLLYHFGISAPWRNKGIGEEVIKGFIEKMKGKCGYIIISNNEPAQFGPLGGPESLYAKQGVELDSFTKDREKAQYKLNAFWQRCGFKLFKDYDNVFICNVDLAVPDYSKAAHKSAI